MKRVLFVNMHFYEYDECIRLAIEKMGLTVDMFYDKADRTILTRALKRINPKSNCETIRNYRYQNKYLNELETKGTKYDFIFVIVGRNLGRHFLKELRRMNSHAVFLLYLWDDIARVKNYWNTYDCYNKIYSFDWKDAREYNLEFLPLFYTDDYRYNGETKNITLYFAGQDHSERVKIARTILSRAGDKAGKMYFYLASARFTRLLNRIKDRDFTKKPDFIHYSLMPMKKNARLTKKSRAILDVPFTSQRGLSIRTFEAIAARAKLITTNTSIQDYEFYRPNNIMIIDREASDLDFSFLETPYEPLPIDIYEKYSVTNWVNNIFAPYK